MRTADSTTSAAKRRAHACEQLHEHLRQHGKRRGVRTFVRSPASTDQRFFRVLQLERHGARQAGALARLLRLVQCLCCLSRKLRAFPSAHRRCRRRLILVCHGGRRGVILGERLYGSLRCGRGTEQPQQALSFRPKLPNNCSLSACWGLPVRSSLELLRVVRSPTAGHVCRAVHHRCAHTHTSSAGVWVHEH